MTLCIARKKGNVSFVSDSRMSFSGTESKLDYAIKVFKIPVKIFSPTDSTTQQRKILYNYTLGMCVSGSSINANIVKESVYETLQNLQHIPLFRPISMDSICEYIRIIYQFISREIGRIFDKKGMAKLIIGGYCLESKTVRAFKFSNNISDYPIKSEVKEILLNKNDIEFIGSGAKKAKNLFVLDNNISTLSLLKQVIEDESIKSVGGPMQYGYFLGNNFEIRGVQDYRVTRDSPEIYYHLRGVDYHTKEYLENSNCGLALSYRFVRPFDKEIKDLLKRKFKNLNSK